MWGTQTIRGVLLDVDGTLVLSNDAHAEAWMKAFAGYGYAVPFQNIRSLIGMGGKDIIKTLISADQLDKAKIEKISVLHKQIFLKEYAKKLQPAHGSRILVKKLRQVGLRLAAASSAQKDILDIMLRTAQVDDLINHAVNAQDVSVAKPEPDIILEGLKKLSLPAHQAALIGDTPYDIAAAHKAQVMVIAVRCGGFSDQQLHGADAIYDDPHDLAINLESSPIAH